MTRATDYDASVENRLASVTLPDAGGTVTYQYDPFGRRIEKVSPAGTTIYAYDGDNVVEELDGGGMAVARYAQGLGIDEPLAMYRGGASYYYNADGLGSITSLTNSSGQIAATYTYDSFGKLTASTGTVTNPFRYTGREYGADTGLYYYRARYYDSNVGRFISEDHLRFLQDANFYRYVENNPCNEVDPTGGGIVDCAKAIGKMARLEAELQRRRMARERAGCPDRGHDKAIEQLERAVEAQRALVAKHCKPSPGLTKFLVVVGLGAAVALAPETGGASLAVAF